MSQRFKYLYHYDSPLGPMTMQSDGTNLTALWFDDMAAEGKAPVVDEFNVPIEGKMLPVFRMTIYWLDTYFAGRVPELIPPMVLNDSSFRKMVWEQLLTIPYGKTITYSEIARRIAHRVGVSRMSAQAVGGAVGHNPILLIVPCHRVIGSDKSLTGYAAGLQRKRWLLDMEKPPRPEKPRRRKHQDEP